MLLKYKYKEATPEERQEMLSEIISQYNVTDKSQLVMALAHCQTLTDCSQEDFANNELIGISDRSVRMHKKEYLETYTEVFEKYKQEPEIVEVEVAVHEDIMEQVYSNMLTKLSNPSTSAKDLSTLLTYLNISSTELKQFAKLRGSSLRSFVKDNEALLIKDEDVLGLVQAMLAESDYLFLGNETTQGRTANYMELDMSNPLVRLELQTAGMLMYGLWNGAINPHFVEMAQTLRVLKMASGQELDTKQAVKDFEDMDSKPKKKKPLTDKLRKDLIDIFGQEEGHQMYQQMLNAKDDVDAKTAIKLPTYEDVKADYDKHLKLFPKLENMPLDILLSKLDAEADKSYKEKYKQYTNTTEEM